MPVPEISALARQIARSDPLNARLQGLIALELRQLRELVYRSGSNELGGCLDGAILLSEMLGRGGEIKAAPNLHRVVCLLIGTVERNFELPGRKPEPSPRPTEQAPPRPAVRPDHHTSAAAATLRQVPVPEDRIAKAFELLNDMQLGEIMVELGSLTHEQLYEGLVLQGAEQLKIGEALIELGHVRWEHVESALMVQTKLRKAAGIDDPITKKTLKPREPKHQLRLAWERLLGEVLVQLGFATESQVEEGLKIQRAIGQPIGQAMMNLGYCTRQQISEAVGMQERLRHLSGGPKESEPDARGLG